VEQTKDIIYIPFWIAGMLQRNNLPVSDILNLRKMAQFLSAQERANLVLFQNFDPFTVKSQGGRNYPTYGSGMSRDTSITNGLGYNPLLSVWRKSIANSTDANDKQLLADIVTAEDLSYGAVTENEVAERFDPENGARVNHTHPFITYDVEREALIVEVFPAFFDTAQYSKHVFALCTAVLKVLYVYNTPSAGCQSPYFRKYLESLV